MRIYMQTMPEAGTEAPRYAQLSLEQDLLGGWTLYRESGIQGGKGMLKRDVFLDYDAALAALTKARDAQLKKGFKVMFSQGQESAHGR